MIPILYNGTETEFDNNGLGGLPDVIKCVVTEERNGAYELEMEYPMAGLHFDDIAVDRLILAKPNITDRAQPFRIYKITRPIDGVVSIYAEHVSYQTVHIPILPFTAKSASEAATQIKENAACDCPFNLIAALTTKADMALFEPKSMRTVLFGSDGSFLDTYGGEFQYDFYDISIKTARGNDNGVTLEYGKNIVDLKQDESIAETITGICPFATRRSGTSAGDVDSEALTLPEGYIETVSSAYAYKRIIPVDLSEELPEDGFNTRNLRKAAKAYCEEHNIGIPDVSIEVDFVALGDTEEYSELKSLEKVSLCDYVTIKFEKLGISTKAKVSKTVFDSLREKYESITIGNITRTISDTISAQQVEQQNSVNLSQLESELKRQAAMITGNAGDSYVVLNPRYNPQEILIMDAPNPSQASNVWRFNKSGLAHGTNYALTDANVAITMDGHIAGEMISAGSINGSSIKAGTITADRLDADVLSAPTITSGSVGGWTIQGNGLFAERVLDGKRVQAYLQMPTASSDCVYLVNHFEPGASDGYIKFGVYTDGRIFTAGDITAHGDLTVSGKATLYGKVAVNDGLKINGYDVIFGSDGNLKWHE